MRPAFLLLLMVSCFASAQDNKITEAFYVTATTKDNQAANITPDQCRVAAGLNLIKIEKLGDAPISYIVAVDTSKSTQELFKSEISAAKVLLRTVIRPEIDRGLVVGFDTKLRMSEVSSNPNELLKFVDSLQIGGGSAVYDAMYEATERLLSAVPPMQPRVMFLISDGEDNSSKMKSSEVKKLLIRSGVRLYPISLSEIGITSRYEKVLNELADETGGVVLRPKMKDKFFDMENPVLLIRGDFSSWYRMEMTVPSGQKQGSMHPTGMRCGEKSIQFRGQTSYLVQP